MMLYRFGDCSFDSNRRELRRGDILVDAEPKVLEVLHYLLQHRQRVVTRDELFTQCWPETSVSDAALTSCLRRVREAIAQTHGASSLIQTLHRRGYRFVGEVAEVVLETDTPALRQTPPRQSPPLAAAPSEIASSPSVRRDAALGSAVPLWETDVPAATVPPSGTARAETPAAPTPSLAPPATTPVPVVMTERRQLTVLSATLADTATWSRYLDSEDRYELLQTWRATCEEIVTQYAGYVAQQVEAAVLVYFGYPQAHEDDAQRAVRSGLALVEAVRRGAMAAWTLPETLAEIRVGIATGIMIVSADAGITAQQPMVVGSASTQAVRLGAVAAPGTVVIGAATAQVVAGYFECKALTDVVLSAAAEPLRGYEVRGESRLQTRLEVGVLHGLTPFVGREAEAALLAERWTSVQEGLGQVVLIQGEAGIGKSRLLQVFKDQISDVQAMPWACRCSPYHQHTALYPLIELLHQLLPRSADTSAVEYLTMVETLFRSVNLPRSETVPLLGTLLGLQLPDMYAQPLAMSPPRQRERTLETLVALVLAQTAHAPMVLSIEDLHWADPTTLAWIELLLAQVESVPLLVVLTSRPGFVPPWEQRPALTPLILQRLTRAQTTRMITQVAGGKSFPEEVTPQILARTDGVPLFVEELTRMMLESGQLREQQDGFELCGTPLQLTIPTTLHDSLMARLDHLEIGKTVAQWGAVLGREFRYEVLAAVLPLDETTIQAGLQQLVEAELLFQRGLFPQAHYRFKHALIQETAYGSILTRHRHTMHQHVAHILETRFADTVSAALEMLAHHYTAAGLLQQAILAWQRASDEALRHSAYQEAIGHLRTALDLLAPLPDSPEHRQHELEIQRRLGAALRALKGSPDVAVVQVYQRLRDLGQQSDEPQHMLPALRGLLQSHRVRGDLPQAQEVAAHFLHLAQAQADPLLVREAHKNLGLLALHHGDLARARSHLEQGIAATAGAEDAGTPAFRPGVDVGVSCYNFAALTLWLLGYPAQALSYSQEARVLAQRLAHPQSLVAALNLAARLHQQRREIALAQEYAEASLHLARQHALTHWLVLGRIRRGALLAAQGQHAEGLSEMQQGLATYHERGARVSLPIFLVQLAAAYGQHGQATAGLRQLAEAQRAMQQGGERSWEAEQYRLQGELLLRQHEEGRSAAERHERRPGAALQTEAEACWRRALEVARQQQARTWELRTAMSLAQLWQQQGKRQAAYDLLAPVYAWFTEGFDTADLQEAQTLLTALASP